MLKTSKESIRAGRSATLIGMLVNTLMIIFKFLGGLFGHSQALIVDAVHSFSDLFTDIVVLFGFNIGRKGADPEHPFGHARFETLSSAGVGLVLIVVAGYLGIDAGLNIYHHTEFHPTLVAMFAAGLSIVLKETLFQYTIHVGRRIKSPVIVANAWHHRSDALSSIAVFAGIIGARINPDWHFLDAYAALIVSLLIIKVGFGTLRRSMRELTDTAPKTEILDKINECACQVNGVINLHDLRVRSSGGLHQMEAHIVVDGMLTVKEGHRIAKEVESCLMAEVEDLGQIIIHIDPDISDER